MTPPTKTPQMKPSASQRNLNASTRLRELQSSVKAIEGSITNHKKMAAGLVSEDATGVAPYELEERQAHREILRSLEADLVEATAAQIAVAQAVEGAVVDVAKERYAGEIEIMKRIDREASDALDRCLDLFDAFMGQMDTYLETAYRHKGHLAKFQEYANRIHSPEVAGTAEGLAEFELCDLRALPHRVINVFGKFRFFLDRDGKVQRMGAEDQRLLRNRRQPSE